MTTEAFIRLEARLERLETMVEVLMRGHSCLTAAQEIERRLANIPPPEPQDSPPMEADHYRSGPELVTSANAAAARPASAPAATRP
jgi:hypothetical protein